MAKFRDRMAQQEQEQERERDNISVRTGDADAEPASLRPSSTQSNIPCALKAVGHATAGCCMTYCLRKHLAQFTLNLGSASSMEQDLDKRLRGTGPLHVVVPANADKDGRGGIIVMEGGGELADVLAGILEVENFYRSREDQLTVPPKYAAPSPMKYYSALAEFFGIESEEIEICKNNIFYEIYKFYI